MSSDEHAEEKTTRTTRLADDVFLKVETFAYLALGLLLALTTVLGMGNAAASLWSAAQQHGAPDSIVVTIDGLLFVLMLVEILHTVRVSFRSGTLVCEPFLIVGLIASIRRVLVITLKSSQTSPATSPQAQTLLHSEMLELVVLGVLILVMVISIYMLRRSASAASRHG